MKKIKSILLMLCAIVMSCSWFVGCKDGETPPETPETETTLTLAEAKTLINNSLAIEDASVALSSIKLGEPQTTPNRNIFVKLVNSEFSFNGQNGANLINGLIQRTGTEWTKYSLVNQISGYEYCGYYDGEYEYGKEGDEYTKRNMGDTYFGLVLQTLDCMYIDILFIESAWASFYNNTAVKTPVESGYTITMSVDMAKFVDFASAECEANELPTEGLFGDGESRQMNKEDGSVSLVINFDKDLNLTGLDLKITSYTFSGSLENAVLEDSIISVKKHSGEITAPDWFDINNYQ